MTVVRSDTVLAIAAQLPGARFVESIDEDGRKGESLWVPYGPGFEIPALFRYAGSHPFVWEMTLAVMDGRPQCIEFHCHATEIPIASAMLHRFPFGQAVENGAIMASRPIDQVPRRAIYWQSLEQAHAERKAVLEQHRRRPNSKRKKQTDEHLREVAEVYRQHVATGKPSQAVGEHFNYKPGNARRVVAEARRRGFLGPASPGRGGEQPDTKGT